MYYIAVICWPQEAGNVEVSFVNTYDGQIDKKFYLGEAYTDLYSSFLRYSENYDEVAYTCIKEMCEECPDYIDVKKLTKRIADKIHYKLLNIIYCN